RPYYRQAADDYIRRLRRYAHVREQEVREASRAPNTAVQRAEEAARLEVKIPDRTTVVALAREGVGWSSRELARQLEGWLLQGRPLAFVIGGSSGLNSSVIVRATARWSLGPLTFPHELARVILCEQLYRAFTILRGEPYHKGV
ncbi:MAG TPA: 23S rRNA (pseudouridine(1915)-N(3))-methyltransferase RlmH, partial [Gemmatimonadales bacterium]|nr:23S rRNA (pseudouridine(1915)-N(3))-methyltransferase RlmH [Gemmatimonadales bacterium]